MALLSVLCSIFCCSSKPPKLPVQPPQTELSERGKQLLEEYEEYVTHGIVFDMDIGDIFFILGPLEGEAISDYSTEYWYENLEIWTYGDTVTVLRVHEDTYLELTVGKSTKDDADKKFATLTPDERVVRPDGSGVHSYKAQDGVIIGAHYQGEVITMISVVSPNAT